MDKKILFLLASVCLAFAYFISSEGFKHKTNLAPAPVFPQLNHDLDLAMSINIIEKATLNTLQITRGPLGWQLVNKHLYPADEQKVLALLTKLSDAKYLAAKTAQPEKYSYLGVQEKGGAKTHKLEVRGLNKTSFVNAHIGYPSLSSQQGTYLRFENDEKSWLIDQNLDLSAKANDWLDKNLISVERNMISRIHIKPTKGQAIILEVDANKEDAFTVSKMSASEQEKTPGAHNLIASSLILLQLEDVILKSEITIPQDHYDISFSLIDGSMINAKLFTIGGKYYGTFDAKGASKSPDSPIKTNVDLQKWVFELPSYKALMMMKSREDYLFTP